MVSTEHLLGFGVAAFVLIVIPGPSVVFTIGRALAYGRGVALATVLGNSLGLLVVLVLVAFGLSVVVRESVTVFLVLKLLGAAYLVHLGVQAIRHRRSVRRHRPRTPLPCRCPKALRQGFVVGVSNPKAFMIFAAVLPQFVDRASGHVQAQMLRARPARLRDRALLGLGVGAAREPAAHLVRRVGAARRGDRDRRRRLDDRARGRAGGHRPTPVTSRAAAAQASRR